MNISARCLQAALLGTLLQIPLHATAGDAAGGIARIAINKHNGAIAFIRLSTVPNLPAGCSTDPYWHFTVPLITELDKQMYGLIVAAQAAGRRVVINGDNVCNDFGSVESLYAVSVQ